MQPYYRRTKQLTTDEISAIRHYRDLNKKQYKWENVKLKTNRPNKDCDVINGYLRGDIPKSQFTKAEFERLQLLINSISSAIEKSSVDHDELLVYKGVHEFKGLKKYIEGKTIPDNGFSSFSSSEDWALKYSGENRKGEKIIFVLGLKRGDKALYIDNIENEWLVQKGSHYHVIRKIQYDDSEIWGKAIVYYLELT